MTAANAQTTGPTNIAIVLDRSGSMSSYRGATIAAVNGYLLEARGDATLREANLDFLIFDSESIDTIRSGVVASMADITDADFVPRGSTPLWDAIGRGVETLDRKNAVSGSKRAVLVIVTDGMENASRRYNKASIKEIIQGRQAAGWLVTFLAAGLEAARQGSDIGIDSGQVASMSFEPAALKSSMRAMHLRSSAYARHEMAPAFTDAERAAMAGSPEAVPGGDAWGTRSTTA